MILVNIFLCIIAGVCFYFGEKAFFKKEDLEKASKLTLIVFRISFIMSNFILSFLIFQLLISVKDSELILWKLFLTVFSIFFYYILPYYITLHLFDYSLRNGKRNIIISYSCYLILSNILYQFFKGSYRIYLFDFNFYFNYIKILEFLAFIGDLINGINGAYTATFNISSFFVYPLLKRMKLVSKDNLKLKNKLEEVKNEISLKANQLKDSIGNNDNLNLNKNIEDELESLNKIRYAYELELSIYEQKEEKSKQIGTIEKLINIIKVGQGSVFILTAFLRCFTLNYQSLNEPINLNDESIIKIIHKFLFFRLPNGFINFVERFSSLTLVLILFNLNYTVSKDRIMDILTFIFSYAKNKEAWHDIKLLVVCLISFSYYLICSLLVVNSMLNMEYKDILHRYLFPGFDFSNLHWYYDISYVLSATYLIGKEFVEYTNLISNKV